MSGYTVRVGHVDRHTEVVSVACEHGEARNTSTTDTSEALEAVAALTELEWRAKVGCGCQMVALEDFWTRWSEARSLWEEDSVNGTSDLMDDESKAFHGLVLRTLQTRACDTCDASMLLRFERDRREGRMARIHRSNCPKQDGEPEPTEVLSPYGTMEGRA